MGMMQDCIGENEEILQERAEAAGKEAVRELRAQSRKDSGDYAKGWTCKVEPATRDSGVEVTVHNRVYQLTQLLENDHKIKNQTGRTFGTAKGDKLISEVAERVGRKFAAGGDAT